MTVFGTLNRDGSLSNARNISQAAMQVCPHFIMVADHYREDESCRCDDPEATEMRMWGYRWNKKMGRWVG